MDPSKRGGFKKSLLLLLFLYVTSQQSRFGEAASDDLYPVLSKDQALFDDSTDPRTKFVSSLTHLLEQDEEGKRSSSFFPLRGKKTPNTEANNAEHYQFLPDAEDKRSQFFPLRGKKIPFDSKRASYFMPMRGRKSDEWDAEEDSQDKRASSFMPMRGKKSYQQFGKSGTYSNVKTDITLPSSSDSTRTAVKRISSFVPVRGRKLDQSKEGSGSNETQTEPLRNKRSISFTPMRGRRLLSNSDEKSDSEFPERIVTTLLDKKAYSFMPMRGRRTSLTGETNDQQKNTKERIDSDPVGNESTDILQNTLDLMASMNAEDKRASSFMAMRGRRQDQFNKYFDHADIFEGKRKMSFMPMRGRKDSDYDSHFTDTSDKRASSFMPMRGRRTLNIANSVVDGNKRASSFMPMRGRRTSETDDYSDIENKRASSFMPMRGRRTLETTDYLDFGDKRASSFMPMRGRRASDIEDYLDIENNKVPSFTPVKGQRDLETTDYSDNADKRASSFMPMRGRRSVMNVGLDDTTGDLEKDSLTSLRGRRLLSDDSEANGKRTYAFMPMRGRRTLNTNNTDDVFYFNSNEYGVEKRGYAFMPMRGRRWTPELDQANYYYNSYPFFMPAGIGSALISRPFGNKDIFINSVKAAASKNRRQYDWESVKRAFHASRGKRLPMGYSEDNVENEPEKEDDQLDEKITTDISLLENLRLKRNIFQPQVVAFQPQRKYIALKRPMSFFATRGKRFDDSLNDRISKLP